MVRTFQFQIASLVSALGCAWPSVCGAQAALSLQEAVDRALQRRPALKAEAERVDAAKGARDQAGKFGRTRIFLFQNENLRPGQTYSR